MDSRGAHRWRAVVANSTARDRKEKKNVLFTIVIIKPIFTTFLMRFSPDSLTTSLGFEDKILTFSKNKKKIPSTIIMLS